MRSFRHQTQSGFTLIELVIVIVIIGILAAVAIPKLTNTADQARLAKQQGTLGALKASWGIAYAQAKTAPTCTQVAANMADPQCSWATPDITCTGVNNVADTGAAKFACTDATINDGPLNITCALIGC